MVALQQPDGRFSKLVAFCEDAETAQPGDLLRVRVEKVGKSYCFVSFIEEVPPATLLSSRAIEFLRGEARRREVDTPENSQALRAKAKEIRQIHLLLEDALKILAGRLS